MQKRKCHNLICFCSGYCMGLDPSNAIYRTDREAFEQDRRAIKSDFEAVFGKWLNDNRQTEDIADEDKD